MMMRELIRNDWTGTHHVHTGCRGMRGSQAPTTVVSIPWAEMPETKLCGYCCPGNDHEKDRLTVERVESSVNKRWRE